MYAMLPGNESDAEHSKESVVQKRTAQVVEQRPREHNSRPFPVLDSQTLSPGPSQRAMQWIVAITLLCRATEEDIQPIDASGSC